MKKAFPYLAVFFSWWCINGGHFSTTAMAQVYKSTDANGNVTYSNIPSKGARKLDLAPPIENATGASVSQSAVDRSGTSQTATPANFPRVDRATQSQRDDMRKKILMDELEAERKALEATKQGYANAASTPELDRAPNGKLTPNLARFDTKMQTLQAQIDSHQKNITLLIKELGAIK